MTMPYSMISNKGDTWHWIQQCHHVRRWIKRGIPPRKTWLGADRPNNGELCNECLALEKKAKP